MDTRSHISNKIKLLRTKHNLSQDELAKKLGMPNRQTIHSIENSDRQVSAVELNSLASLFGISMAEFFPAEEISSEADEEGKQGIYGRVLWRARPTSDASILEAQFLKEADNFSFFERLLDEKGTNAARRSLPQHFVDIAKMTRIEAERLAVEVHKNLGLNRRFPATNLVKTLDEDFGTRFFTENQIPLMAEKKRKKIGLNLQFENVGSAACAVAEDGVPCILVNSEEPRWRQNFSVAHELFHLVTWRDEVLNAMGNNSKVATHAEALAEAFAAALLMPQESVELEFQAASQNGKIALSAIVAIARSFDVSLCACLYRLQNLRLLSNDTVLKLLKNEELLKSDRESREGISNDGYRYSERLLRLSYLLIERGKISRAKAARSLGMSLVDFDTLLETEGLIELEDSLVEITHS